MPVCDRHTQTDRHTMMANTHASLAPRAGKNFSQSNATRYANSLPRCRQWQLQRLTFAVEPVEARRTVAPVGRRIVRVTRALAIIKAWTAHTQLRVWTSHRHTQWRDRNEIPWCKIAVEKNKNYLFVTDHFSCPGRAIGPILRCVCVLCPDNNFCTEWSLTTWHAASYWPPSR